MWIRSQDRTGLFMSYGMCIDEFDGEFVISDTGGFGRCANYSTKEKALLVLNYMQSEIQNNVCDEQTVFEMPTDDEV